MTFGLSTVGFTKKRLEDIRAELETAFRSVFGQGIKTTPDTVFGKLIGILADDMATLWELGEAVYNSQYPNSASGQSLAKIGEITGAAPNGATNSVATAYVAGTNGTVVPSGSRIAVQDTGQQFALASSATLLGQVAVSGITRSGSVATAAATAHGLAALSWVFIVGANQPEYNGLKQIATVPNANSFTYAVSGTPVTPATGAFSAKPAVAVLANSVETGPVQAPALTLNTIVNPIPGWDLVNNAVDAVLGKNAETDAEFRARRLIALQGLGAARHAALEGALFGVQNVTAVTVFVNDTDVTDADGRPPHSIECMCVGGLDQDIRDTIWAKKAAGIQTHGGVTGSVVDSQGVSHTVKHSRPTAVNIYLILDLTVTADYPVNGDAQVLADVLAYAATLGIGDDVIVTPALVGSFAAVPGITAVTVKIGTAPAPTLPNNIAIAATEIAVFDSSRITVNSP